MVITMKSMMMRQVHGGNFTIRQKMEPPYFVIKITSHKTIEDRAEIQKMYTKLPNTNKVMPPEVLGSVDEAEVAAFLFCSAFPAAEVVAASELVEAACSWTAHRHGIIEPSTLEKFNLRNIAKNVSYRC